MSQTEKYIPAKAAADLISVSKRTWHRLDASGKVPAPVRIGKIIRWKLAELIAWINSGTPDRTQWNSVKGSANE